jgi:hypothetical protein
MAMDGVVNFTSRDRARSWRRILIRTSIAAAAARQRPSPMDGNKKRGQVRLQARGRFLRANTIIDAMPQEKP